jgi:two-component system chemotaxis response regulator CheB
MEENAVKSNCKVLLIGGSAGSLEVLMAVIPKLKPISNFAIVIILHRKSTEDLTLENLIAMKTKIPVVKMEDKEILKPGFIYIAPSDYHLLFEKSRHLSLDVSEKVHYSRPSIDVSFESAALAFGNTCTAILLSGANADGTDGLLAIQKAGGMVILQDPKNALMPFMPLHALETLIPNYILDVEDILEFINSIELE